MHPSRGEPLERLLGVRGEVGEEPSLAVVDGYGGGSGTYTVTGNRP